MEIVTGPPVTSDKFYGRERELARMRKVMETSKNASLFIPGPRRVGKSSLTKEFIERNKDNYNCLYFNLQDKHTIVELCEGLHEKFCESFPDSVKRSSALKAVWNSFSEMFPKVKVAGVVDIKTGKLTADGKKLLSDMADLLADLTHNENLVIIFDEFSDFLLHLNEIDEAGQGNSSQAQRFLEWLRNLRQNEKVRLIITGSVNVISTVEQMNVLDLVNDLVDIDLIPLNEGEISDFLSRLLKSRNIQLNDECLAFAVDKLSDGIPYYVQLFASAITQQMDGQTSLENVETLAEIYKKIVSGTQKVFENFHSRLSKYWDQTQQNAAKKILAHLSQTPMSIEDLSPQIDVEKQLLHKILKRLMDECYIFQQGDKFAFVSPMLQQWWQNSYGWEQS